MATFTGSYTIGLSTDANYHTLWGDVESHIRSLGGWTYVSQTGDGDPSTVTSGAAGTYAAFRVYSTTVGSTTWYMRVDYGKSGANGPALKAQFGTTVNGSGTLGGQTSTQLTTTSNNTDTETLWMSTATGRVTVVIGSSSFSSIGFSMHGDVDSSGAMQSGVEIFSISSVASQYVPSSGTIPPQRTLWPTVFGNSTSDIIGGVTMTGHPVLWGSAGANNPTLAVMVYSSSDFAATFTTNVTVYSASRTYICTLANSITGVSSNTRAGFRYE